MKKRFQILTLLITVIFMTFFSAINTIDCLCCIPDFLPMLHQDTQPCESCCYDNSFTRNRTPDHSYNDNCCKDNSPTFITDIPEIIHNTYQLKLKNQNTLSSLLRVEDDLKLEFSKNQSLSHQLKLLLPKIIDIRIFIQSFIN